MQRMTTLAIDCGGGGIKASVLDEVGTMRAHPIRVPTPYPLPTDLFVTTLTDLAAQLPKAERATVGLPGMIRHGVVVTTPHYVTKSGPRTRVLPELVEPWEGFDAQAAMEAALGIPTRVLNDAEIHGAGVIAGAGLDVYAQEPHVPQALLDAPNATLLPHLGTATDDTRTRMGLRALANLQAHIDGGVPPDLVR